jgi:hypothetical protein
VEGAVVDRQGKPVGGAVLALLPKDGSLEHLKTGVANAEGKYYFPSNPPGEYKLLAWEDVDTALLQQPGFLQQLDASAQSVQLGAGGRETIRLTAIPASGR